MHPDDREYGRDQLAETLLDRRGQVVDVVGDPAQHVAVGVTVEVTQRQPTQFRFDVAP
jgi:hypothetical protein